MSSNFGFTVGFPLTENDAKEVAETLGLQLGGHGFPFARPYRTKGLYSYNTGKFQGIAFFGTGGSDQDKNKSVKFPKYRPTLIVADPDEDFADPDEDFADPDDDEVAKLPASRGVRAKKMPLTKLDVHVKTLDGSDEFVQITSDMTIGELQSKMQTKTKLMPGELTLILDEDDPKNGNITRLPFLTPIGVSMDRRSDNKESESIEYERTVQQGFTTSKTSTQGGGEGKSAGWSGSFGTGLLVPVTIEATASGNYSKGSNWSLSDTVTVENGKEETETFNFDAGYVTQVYVWAIMLPDANNIDRVFIIPSDDGPITFRNGKFLGKTVEEHNADQKIRVKVSPQFPAPAVIAPKPKVWFRLKNKHGNYLSCPGNALNTSKPLYIDKHYASQAGQLWCVEPIVGQGTSTVRIKSKLTKRGKSYYMCVYSGHTHNGAHIGVWQSAGSSSQGWTIADDCKSGSGGYITHSRSRRVLATYGNRSWPGHNASILYSAKNEAGQRWELEYVE